MVSIILLSSGCLGQGEGGPEFLGIEYRDPPEAQISFFSTKMGKCLN